MLILVVGPSGAGKDSLLNAARRAFRDDPPIRFVRRVITRPPDPDGEDHEAVSPAEFAARDFALSWSAHGLSYGIPAEALADVRGANVPGADMPGENVPVTGAAVAGMPGTLAPVLVVNFSRGVIADAAARWPTRVIEITAPPEVLAARLAARGREGTEDMARRLARSATIPDGVAVETVWNDGTLAAGEARFVATLRRIARETGR